MPAGPGTGVAVAARAGVDAEAVAVADAAVIVVAYHCRDQVLACVERVLATATRHEVELVVVDNGSTDGTVPALRAASPAVTVIEMGTNAGFSRANNRGIAATTARHVVILNPDTLVAPGAVDRLIDWLDDHPRAGVAAPRLVFPDGRDQQTARAFPTAAAAVFGRRSPLTRLFPRNRWSSRFLTGRDHPGDEPFRVDWVSGAAMAVPRTVVDRVGGFDEGFFLYWEDADWCRRIATAGYEVWCVPAAVVVHDEGGTRGHGWPAPVVRHFHAGAYRYYRLHHAPQWWNPLRWLAAAGLTLRAGVVLVPRPARRRPADAPHPADRPDRRADARPDATRDAEPDDAPARPARPEPEQVMIP